MIMMKLNVGFVKKFLDQQSVARNVEEMQTFT